MGKKLFTFLSFLSGKQENKFGKKILVFGYRERYKKKRERTVKFQKQFFFLIQILNFYFLSVFLSFIANGP